MKRRWIAATALASACGAAAPRGRAIALEAAVAAQAWYRSPSICGQGPYEIDVPTGNARWGESYELRVSTPRPIAIHAAIVADDRDVATTDGVFDRNGRIAGDPANARCVADARERRAALRGGASGDGGGPAIVMPGGSAETVQTGSLTARLELETGLVPPSFEVLHGDRRAGRIRIRVWSNEPNDLEGVVFGVSRIEWRPNVPVAEYDAHLARIAAEGARRDREWRQRQPQRSEIDRVRIEQERERRAEDERRRRAIADALEAERQRRRDRFCAAHPEDRECWGAGGLKVYLELESREAERARYCVANGEDARCWSTAERGRRENAWRERIRLAEAKPLGPDGPPPDPLQEIVPPKLSVHAEWRPGYWQWTGTSWTWLGGMWRVPDDDIVAEQTTIAPGPPPPPCPEAVPPPPMRTTIWIGGFWQWNGAEWVWVAGSYQARPAVGMSWRPTVWKPRGTRHVLIPGGWIRAGVR